tara:strand:- start:5841 stop:7292 length:1452 start_codon:yes stop_codon:yes gene_type:complete
MNASNVLWDVDNNDYRCFVQTFENKAYRIWGKDVHTHGDEINFLKYLIQQKKYTCVKDLYEINGDHFKLYGAGYLLKKYKGIGRYIEVVFASINATNEFSKLKMKLVAPGTWDEKANVQFALKDLYNHKLKFDSNLKFDKQFIYGLQKKDFINSDYAGMYAKFQSCAYKVVIFADLPNLGEGIIKPYLFKVNPHSIVNENNCDVIRDILVHLYTYHNDENCSTLKQYLYKLNFKKLNECGFPILRNNFKSIQHLVASAKFDFEMIPWEFHKVPANFHELKENRIRYMEYLKQRLNIVTMEQLYKITKFEIEINNGSSILRYYRGSPLKFVQDIYPHYDWDAKKFRKNVSKIELIYIEKIIKELNCESEMLWAKSKKGQYRVPDTKFHLDGYLPCLNIGWEFHGSFYHGNPNLYAPDFVNKKSGKLMGELYKNTIERSQIIRSKGIKLIEIWDSDFYEILKKERDFNIIIDVAYIDTLNYANEN